MERLNKMLKFFQNISQVKEITIKKIGNNPEQELIIERLNEAFLFNRKLSLVKD